VREPNGHILKVVLNQLLERLTNLVGAFVWDACGSACGVETWASLYEVGVSFWHSSIWMFSK